MRISQTFRITLLSLILVFCMLAASPALAQRGISVTSAKPIDSERRVALVIGNGGYKSNPLRNPVNDARAMTRALSSLGFEVIKGEDLTKAEMQQSIIDFAQKLRGSGVGLFYYAGHGVQVNGRNYLIPIGARIPSQAFVEVSALDLNWVNAAITDARNRLNIIVLDACRDNPLPKGVRSGGKGLAVTPAPKGTLIAYATAPGSTAADGSGRNGLYTSQLLKYMQTPGLPVEWVFKRVRQGVDKASGGKQIPWEHSSIVGDFYFKPGNTWQPVQLAGGSSQESVPGVVKPRGETTPPPPKPEPAKIKPAGTADIYITTDPSQAMVYLDGVQKGRSPQTLEMIPAGRHVIDVRKGYLVGRKELTLVRDDLKKVYIKLEHQKGDVKVFSEPAGAEVRLNGKEVCNSTPCKIAGINAGDYKLEVVRWKGAKCWDYQSQVEVKPGGNRFTMELKRNSKAESERAEEEQKRRAQVKARAEAARKERERIRREASRIIERSSDGRFTKTANGVITDSRTGLQWYVGPDRNTNWYSAKKWVEGQSGVGGGWRMPSQSELRGISEKSARSGDPKYLLPIFKTNGYFVWSNRTRDSSNALYFNFIDGKGYWVNRNDEDYDRAFAVRSRR